MAVVWIFIKKTLLLNKLSQCPMGVTWESHCSSLLLTFLRSPQLPPTSSPSLLSPSFPCLFSRVLKFRSEGISQPPCESLRETCQSFYTLYGQLQLTDAQTTGRYEFICCRASNMLRRYPCRKLFPHR